MIKFIHAAKAALVGGLAVAGLAIAPSTAAAEASDAQDNTVVCGGINPDGVESYILITNQLYAAEGCNSLQARYDNGGIRLATSTYSFIGACEHSHDARISYACNDADAWWIFTLSEWNDASDIRSSYLSPTSSSSVRNILLADVTVPARG